MFDLKEISEGNIASAALCNALEALVQVVEELEKRVVNLEKTQELSTELLANLTRSIYGNQ